ncbi:hypothetical protein GCM10010381_66060 [Streptomyces xantholiticus]|nr:hypothetical protein GCM10010381_66060 [Streptomyces xantholiticus]
MPGGIQDHLHDDLAVGLARLRVVLPGVQHPVRVAVQNAVKETERVRGTPPGLIRTRLGSSTVYVSGFP